MKTVRKISIILLCAALICAAVGTFFYFAVTAGAVLDDAKLERTDACIEVYDSADNKIADLSFKSANKSIHLNELPAHIPNAFIAAEDKNFYSHHGLDYKGMIRALLKNIKAGAFRQGASTISQQLVKNTQLSSEKTLTRKLKEIRLTRQLEKRYTKTEILEMYLNTIYFGHACYGIAGAADFYFSKPASSLSAAEAATLAAIIKSPNNYSPFLNPEKCLTARNSVLKRMQILGFITESESEQAKSEPLPEKQDNSIASKTYLSGVYAEMESLPLYSPYQYRGGCKIYTYMDSQMQDYAENLKTDADRSGKSMLICDNRTHGIIAWYTTEGDIRRQPGSVIKPLAVYAPAVEENKISPCTPLSDEKTDFGGYSPSNYKDEYRGYVSAREALALSLNIPAVKILNSLGVEKSEAFLRRMQLFLPEADKNLSLALGGMSEGFTLREIAAAYSTFANSGNFAPVSFIRRIEDADGNTLYTRSSTPQKVFSEDTAALMNEMLACAAKKGTAKKMACLPFEVCAKTGTCGTDEGNTDAWTVSYTTAHTVAVWMGNADNTLTDITGGGLPCHYAMLLNKRLYRNTRPQPFTSSPKIVECRLDKIAYEQDHSVKLAAENTPIRYTFTDLFRISNQPKEFGSTFTAPSVSAKIHYENSAVFIDLCQTEYYDYVIKREQNGKTIQIYDGHCDNGYEDDTVLPNKKYTYSITPYFLGEDGKRHYGKEITLPSVYCKQTKQSPPKNWWNS